MKKKVTFIGGGSSRFVRDVSIDMLLLPELQDIHIELMDIDAERADRSCRLLQRIITDLKVPATTSWTTDQRRGVEGADYVIVTIMVGGMKHYLSDTQIPIKYGVLPAVGDTIGPGAAFRIVRTQPVLAELADNLRQVAPHAQVLNYANPMAMNTWCLLDAGWGRTVGLCHSIQSTVTYIARWLDIPAGEIDYEIAGINHLSLYTKLERHGRDLYPDLLAARERICSKEPCWTIFFEMIEYLGGMSAEGPWHQSEYYPWFRKNQQTADAYHVETGWGYRVDSTNYTTRITEAEEEIVGSRPIEYKASSEFGAKIVHSMETGTVRTVYGNVRNSGLIENLPPEAVVEVPCMVNRNGILPCRVGKLPPQFAQPMRSHISMHEMVVRAVQEKNRTLLRQAVQADPLTGAILTLPQIKAMVEELSQENAAYMQGWK